MSTFFIIIFPRGDRKKLSIAEISQSMSYEKEEYLVASKNDFFDVQEACEYAKVLALKNGLEYIPPKHIQEINYLD